MYDSKKSGYQLRKESDREFIVNFGCTVEEYEVRRKKFCADKGITDEEFFKSRKTREEWNEIISAFSK